MAYPIRGQHTVYQQRQWCLYNPYLSTFFSPNGIPNVPFVKLSTGPDPTLSKVYTSVSLGSNATDKKYVKKSKAILMQLLVVGSKEKRVILIYGHLGLVCLEEII